MSNPYLAAIGAAPFGKLAEKLGQKTRKAYHGSPHDFRPAARVMDKDTGKTYVIDQDHFVYKNRHDSDRYEVLEEYPEGAFSVSRIGTGEGAQAYGHGLYFSSKEEIGKFYRDQLSTTQTFLDGKRLAATDPDYEAAIRIGMSGGVDEALARIDEILETQDFLTPEGVEAQKMLKRRVEGLRGRAVESKKSGSLFTVEIPDESNMLDWDKPLSEQPESVKKAIQPLLDEMHGLKIVEQPTRQGIMFSVERNGVPTGLYETREAAEKWAKDLFAAEADLISDDTGERLLIGLRKQLGGPSEASAKLRELGIPGITYKGATSGERNFVIFDDELINLVEKGFVDPKLLAPLAAAGAFTQARQGKDTPFKAYMAATGRGIKDLLAEAALGVARGGGYWTGGNMAQVDAEMDALRPHLKGWLGLDEPTPEVQQAGENIGDVFGAGLRALVNSPPGQAASALAEPLGPIYQALPQRVRGVIEGF